MVDHPSYRTGIDLVGPDYLAAQVEKQGAQVKVLALSKIARGDLARSLFSDNCLVVLSVPDDYIILKNVNLSQKPSNSTDKIIRFELQHALLDNPADFCCDIIDTGESTHTLAMVARKNKLEKISDIFQTAENGNIRTDGFVARSIALGRGFLHFCSNDTERLVCLANFDEARVSLCFVLGNNVITCASFDRTQFELDTESGFSRLAAELKTIINFKLNELAGRGKDAGLSRLVVSGGVLNQVQKESIASKLGVQLEEPVFDRLLSDNPVIDSNRPISDFLVSLGLTVE